MVKVNKSDKIKASVLEKNEEEKQPKTKAIQKEKEKKIFMEDLQHQVEDLAIKGESTADELYRMGCSLRDTQQIVTHNAIVSKRHERRLFKQSRRARQARFLLDRVVADNAALQATVAALQATVVALQADTQQNANDIGEAAKLSAGMWTTLEVARVPRPFNVYPAQNCPVCFILLAGGNTHTFGCGHQLCGPCLTTYMMTMHAGANVRCPSCNGNTLLRPHAVVDKYAPL